jgi:hypothetical protein
MEVGESYVVFFLLDEETDRLIGSGQIEDFLFTEDLDVEEGDEVKILAYKRSDLGINVIVNGQYQGLIFKSVIHKTLQIGNTVTAYIKKIRADGKLDVVLEAMGYRNIIDSASKRVLAELQKNDGFIPYTDKSKPDDVRNVFNLSKKAFKKALGNLYKNKIVTLEKDGTRLVK